LYEKDVHYYLTRYLASMNKCFLPGEADRIAEGDQWTDEDPDHRPGPGFSYKQRTQNRDYHALHVPPHETYLDKLWTEATRGHLNDPDRNLKYLGVFLHYRQDMFSHAHYTNALWGHLFGSHSVDKTTNDRPKALEMARTTWAVLQAFAWEKKCRCQGNAGNISRSKLYYFIRAYGGNGLREIDAEELETKRRILEVPNRIEIALPSKTPSPFPSKTPSPFD
jgi:hypothetical protein